MSTDNEVVSEPRRFFQSPGKVPYKKAPKESVALGIRKAKSGSLEARVRAGGQTHQRIFPPGTTIETAQTWRRHMRATYHAPHTLPHHRSLPPSINGWCYLYFVRQGSSVKIGRAADVTRRLEELQTASASTLTLLVAVAAHASLENEYIKRFEPYRLNGEWFIYGPEITQIVQRLKDGANPIELLFVWNQIMSPTA